MEKMEVVKVTVGQRVFFLRQPKISDTRLAAKSLGNKSGSQVEMQMALQEELVKLLLVQIDDKKLSDTEKRNLDNIISLAEYNRLIVVIQKLTSGGEEGELELEFSTL